MKVAIIGGSGQMGRWFADILAKEGNEVVVTGRNEEKLREAERQLGVETTTDNIAAVRGADYVVLSVPIEGFAEVVRQVSPHLESGQAVIDITSVKEFTVDTMHQHVKSGLVLGTHPLFGPGAGGIAGQNFILTPTGDQEDKLARKVKEYLEDREGNVTLMTPQEHDGMMSIILGLSHYIALVSADTLLDSGKLQQMASIGGTTYKILLTMATSVLSEDPELYASIQMYLPAVTEMESLFQGKAREWAELVAGKDRQEFIRRMKALRAGFEQVNPDFDKAYRDTYRIVEGL